MNNHTKPLLVGRLLRVLFGLAAFAGIFLTDEPLFWVVLLFFGVSFVVGGVMAYPGCEVLVLPNLLFRKRLHCF